MDIYVYIYICCVINMLDQWIFMGLKLPFLFRSPQPPGPHVPANSCLRGRNPSSASHLVCKKSFSDSILKGKLEQ